MERPRIKDYTHLRYIDKAHYIDYSDALNKYIDHQASEITSLKEQLEKMTDDRNCVVQAYQDTKSELEEENERLKEQLETQKEEWENFIWELHASESAPEIHRMIEDKLE